MDKIWKVIVDFIIAIGIMFIAVMIYYGLRTETVVKSLTTDMTEDFIYGIKKDGSFTLNGYEKYLEQLSYTNAIYDINFEHRYDVLEPEYRFRTLEEIIEAQNKEYKGPNDYHYKEIVSELPVVHDPVNTEHLNTETNESVLRNSVDKAADPNHIHTDECYGGHQHEGAKTFPHVHQHTWSCVEYVSQAWIDYCCNVCGYEGTILYESYTWDASSGSTRLGARIDQRCYNNNNCRSTNITTKRVYFSYNYSCYYNIDLDGDGLHDRVDRTKEYTYYWSSPQEQEINLSQEYTNGCYSTITKGYFKTYLENYYGEKTYKAHYVMQGLRTYGVEAFCEIPKSYSFDLSCYTQYNDYELSISFSIFDEETLRLYDNWGNRFSFEEFMYYTSEDDRLTEYLHTYTRYTNYKVSHIKMNTFSKTVYKCSHENHNVWKTNCGLEEGGGLACDKIIVILTPTHPIQKVFIGDDIISTARATYLNGSEKTILCNSEFVADELGQDIPVTLWTSYTIVNREYIKTCEIVVTVIPRTNTCDNGHMYYLTEDGLDPGCPYCKAWAKSLRVIYPISSPITITIGTTLIENNIQILVTYMNGDTKVITNGYIDNLDSGYLGTQRVTIGYHGALTTVMVTTVRARIICEICGFEYELYPNGENPGCPRCLSKTPIFTGNVLAYQKVNYTEEILAMLQEKGEYSMKKDDVFVIDIRSKSKSIGRSIMKGIYPSLGDTWYQIRKNVRIRSK